MNVNNEVYWASAEIKECVKSLILRVSDYYDFLVLSGTLNRWKSSYQHYNQAASTANQLVINDNGLMYSSMFVNHYRNFLQHLLVMTVNQRPSFEPSAVNTDLKSQSQTILARGLLDYYMRQKRLEIYLKQAVEYALLFAEGYVLSEWNATAGEAYSVDPDTKIPAKPGDIEYSAKIPLDVIKDVMASTAEEIDWYIVRKFKNRYDLAAKYEEYAQELVSYNPNANMKYDLLSRKFTTVEQETDLIPVYTFYHDRTDALPDGRQIEYVDDKIILTDGPLAYREKPVYRVSGAELIGTPFGYTIMYDLIPIQASLNMLYSTILTNQEMFGVQNVLVPKGSGISVSAMAGGLNVIEYDPNLGKPEAFNLTHTPTEIFNFINKLEGAMEIISGVNSVARGEPQSSLKSGAALALVQSQAIQFSQGLQHAYTQLLESVGGATINILRDYASVPRIAMIVGKNNRGQMREFSSKDLDQVNRVAVSQGNPLTRTTAGKVELATMMLQNGLIQTPDQLLQVINTGNLDVLTEGKTNELLSIKAENETLADGQAVPVMITDLHLTHIQEHKCILSDPVARENPDIVKIVTEHIQEHYKFLSDPSIASLLSALGQQSLAAPVPVSPTGATTAPTPTANQNAEGMLPGMPNMPQPSKLQ